MKKNPPHLLLQLVSFTFLLISTFSELVISKADLQSEATSLLNFKSRADLHNKLRFSTNDTSHHCHWSGIKCVNGKVTRLVLEGFNLAGIFAADTLSRLDQLRVLSLQNNSLAGPIPDLAGLVNLKSLFLDHNLFSGNFPASISTLKRVRTVDLSYNDLIGSIPIWLTKLEKLSYLRVDGNGFRGAIPALNQSSLQTLNFSGNNLRGAIPVTVALLRFPASAFSRNPRLCGEIIHRECRYGTPFFGPSIDGAAPAPSVTALGQNAQLNGVELTQPRVRKRNHLPLLYGFIFGSALVLFAIVCFVVLVRKWSRNRNRSKPEVTASSSLTADETAAVVMRIEEENELVKRKVDTLQVAKSGSLVFCAGEAQVYTLDQLMRGSAELLGRGTIGTTYKAVLDNRLIVCVKRLDGGKTAGTSQEVFEQHMGSVGGLRHPNLVPLRAYFQAKEERLLVYDYHPNGSLFSLIHGSKSTRAKPLHWTSCLKIAEDIAQGLSYIHQAWRLVHGNLKSSNVLLGPDFEACLTDYCLSVLTTSSSDHDPNSTAYRGPELKTYKTDQNPETSKSDVYAFGILLLEILSGKHPSQHPNIRNDNDLLNWVKSTREDDCGDDSSLVMLVGVAVACSASSPEQRPTMWQVLKMIQEIKDTLFAEDGDLNSHTDVPS